MHDILRRLFWLSASSKIHLNFSFNRQINPNRLSNSSITSLTPYSPCQPIAPIFFFLLVATTRINACNPNSKTILKKKADKWKCKWILWAVESHFNILTRRKIRNNETCRISWHCFQLNDKKVSTFYQLRLLGQLDYFYCFFETGNL